MCKQPLIGFGILIVILAGCVSAGETGETVEDTLYEDRAGLYQVPIPTNWTVEESRRFVTLAGPDGDLLVHILAVDGDDPEEAIEAAWQIVDPDFDRALEQKIDIPPSAAGGVDEFILLDYEREEEDPIVQVEGRRIADRVFVLIFTAELAAAQRRGSQLQIIDSGFTINALEVLISSG